MKKWFFLFSLMTCTSLTAFAHVWEIGLKICSGNQNNPISGWSVVIDRWNGCSWTSVEPSDYTSTSTMWNYYIDIDGNCIPGPSAGCLQEDNTYRMRINDHYFLLTTGHPEGAGSYDSYFVIVDGNVYPYSVSEYAIGLSLCPCSANPFTGYVTASISGPSSLGAKEFGTYYVSTSCGSGNFSYQWAYMENYLGTWFNLGTSTSQTMRMNHADRTIRCSVTDLQTGYVYTASMIVYYGSLSANLGEDASSWKSEFAMENASGSEFEFGNYPNPFNPTTTIGYGIPEDGHVLIEIFDALGRDIETLVDEVKPAGHYVAIFNGSWLPSGVYIARISVTSTEGMPLVRTSKLLLTK